jgi:ribosomal protein L11 methylase PrmA
VNTDGTVAGSFRDPSGFLYTRDGILYRQVNRSFADEYDKLMSSGLYQKLVDDGLLVAHDEVDVGLAARPADAHKVLRPERIGLISYPYEWSFGMLRDAALATLRIQMRAMDAGMTLRDASAYNIQFRAGKPVLIDTLSLGVAEEGAPWVGYAQFCRHFLAPLALMAKRDVRLSQLLRVHIDGVPLDLAASLVPGRTKWRPGLFMHLHAHAKSQKRHAGNVATARATKQRRLSAQALRGVIRSLEKTVASLKWKSVDSTWGSYYADSHNYTDEALESKKSLVAKFLDDAAPSSVWDLGGNTGLFTRIAADRGIPSVCFDFDEVAVEANYRQIRTQAETHILPLVLDLTNPSTSIGWAGTERMSLGERGPVDCVMALALVHHLAISNNVPLGAVADYFASLGHWLIVEFVPKTDSKVETLLASREDIFVDYTREGFEAAFQGPFEIQRSEPVQGSERTLYLMRRR